MAVIQRKKSTKEARIKDTDVEAAKILTFILRTSISIEIQHVIEIIGVPHITSSWLPSYIKGIINARKVVPVVNIRARFDKPEIPYDERLYRHCSV